MAKRRPRKPPLGGDTKLAKSRKKPPNPAKEGVQQWARDLVEGSFLVFDTETTGTGKKDEIVQIGILNQDGEVVLNTLVKPTITIPSNVTKIHGIDNVDVEDAPTMDELYIKLSTLIAGQDLVAYNIDFDWRMMQQSLAKYQLPLFRPKALHCAMKQYAKFWGERSTYNQSYKWQKLGNAAKQQRIPVVNAHDALGDSVMTLKLIQKMANSR